MMGKSGTTELLLISHVTLRRVVGVLGLLLPPVLAVWGFALSGWSVNFQDSISDYYGLRTRDAFVGILFLIACFLFTYKGHENLDNILSKAACGFALGVAFFPNSGGSLERIVHFASAVCLFAVLALISLFLFTKSFDSPKGFALSSFRSRVKRSSDPRKSQKTKRNRVYVVCGVLMLVFMGLTVVYYVFLQNTAVSAVKPVFWLESLMVWAFGFSWLVKGESLSPLNDKKARQGEIN